MNAPQLSVADLQLRTAQFNENIVLWLLSHWVSEIEPAVAYDQHGNIIGLTMADAPIGSGPLVFWPPVGELVHLASAVTTSNVPIIWIRIIYRLEHFQLSH